MPSSRHFFYDLFQRDARGKDRGSFNMLGMLYGGVERLVRQSWGLSLEDRFIPEEWRDVNIEDVLSFVDVGTRMYTRGSEYHRAFRHSREALVEFITMMLMTRSHGQHCELFTEIAFTLKQKDTVINFNYDTIAEFTLQRTRRKQYANYARLMSGSLPKVKDYEDLGLLLKLHGSVNWRTCSNRSCKLHKIPHIAFTTLRRRLPMGLANVSSPCLECAAERPSTAIIPPMSEKNLAKYDFFHRLWLIARAQLPYFKRIAFIGYSF